MYCRAGSRSIDEWTPNWALPPLKIKRKIVETPASLCQGDLLASSSPHCKAVFCWRMKHLFLKMQPKNGQDGFRVNLSPNQPSTTKNYLPQGRLISERTNKRIPSCFSLWQRWECWELAKTYRQVRRKADPRQGSAVLSWTQRQGWIFQLGSAWQGG